MVTIAQAAFTKPTAIYPGFVNVTSENDTVTITVRGDANDGECGVLVALKITRQEWLSFMANVKAIGL